MNGIEKMTARIRADAQAECAEIRAESEARCAEIRAENERLAQERYWALVREGVKETEQRVQRMDRTARLEAKKSVLNMKQEAVSRAFDLARKKLSELPETDYVAFLAREAAEASATGQELILSEEGQGRRRREGRQGRQRAARQKTPGRRADPLGGTRRPARLILKQGDIEVNCSGYPCSTLRGELAARVAEVLFEG